MPSASTSARTPKRGASSLIARLRRQKAALEEEKIKAARSRFGGRTRLFNRGRSWGNWFQQLKSRSARNKYRALKPLGGLGNATRRALGARTKLYNKGRSYKNWLGQLFSRNARNKYHGNRALSAEKRRLGGINLGSASRVASAKIARRLSAKANRAGLMALNTSSQQRRNSAARRAKSARKREYETGFGRINTSSQQRRNSASRRAKSARRKAYQIAQATAINPLNAIKVGTQMRANSASRRAKEARMFLRNVRPNTARVRSASTRRRARSARKRAAAAARTAGLKIRGAAP